MNYNYPAAIPTLIPTDINVRTQKVSKIYPVQTLGSYTTWKLPVTTATTADIDLNGLQTVDGIDLIDGDRVLVKNQIVGSENGIYVVKALAFWLRSNDLQNGSNAANIVVISNQGDTNQNISYLCTNVMGEDIVGTDSLVFEIEGGGGGGGTPGGSDQNVQYNNAGEFGGSDLFNFNPTLIPPGDYIDIAISGQITLGSDTGTDISLITAQNDVLSGNGGGIMLAGGYTSTADTGGGAAIVTGGRSPDGEGGQAQLLGGSGKVGGTLNIEGGAGTEVGGNIEIYSGTGTSQNGGDIEIISGGGAATGGSLTMGTGSGEVAGIFTVNCGNGTTGAGGDFTVNGGNSTDANAGGFSAYAGDSVNLNGGSIAMFAGASTNNNGGSVIVSGGNGGVNGGSVFVYSGIGDSASGSINLVAQSGTVPGSVLVYTDDIITTFENGGIRFTKGTSTIADLTVPPTINVTARQGIITITDPSAVLTNTSITITVNNVNTVAEDSIFVCVNEFNTAGTGIPMVLVTNIIAATSFEIQLYNIGAAAFSNSPMILSYLMS